MADKHASKKVKGGDHRVALTFQPPTALLRAHPVIKGCFAIG
jgi:hypothetical protein